MEQGNTGHVPVMLEEVLASLELKPGMRVIDATLGGGGYTRAILEHIGRDGQLIALDWDEKAIQSFREQSDHDRALSEAFESGCLILVHTSYSRLMEVLQENGWDGADAIVADLGLSSDQLSDPSRGLSFQVDGPLDMRLNSDETARASQFLAEWDEETLADLFQTYGDEPEAARIAKAVVEARRSSPLQTTTELRELIWANVVPARRRGKAHPATRVFQALRMAVNSERTHLERFLLALPSVLRPGGRAAIVTFHSGEDSLVKKLFQQEIRSDKPCLKGVTKKPLVPTVVEIRSNPRSRSAKLRVVERLP